MRDGKIQAYVGEGSSFAGAPPERIRAIESLGAFVVVRDQPGVRALRDRGSACAVVKASCARLPAQSGFIPHPYPVTPFHGDYLHHADLAAAAKARFSATEHAGSST